MNLLIDNLIDSFGFVPAERDHNTIHRMNCLKIQIGFDVLPKSYQVFLEKSKEESMKFWHQSINEICFFESKSKNAFLLLSPTCKLATVFIYRPKLLKILPNTFESLNSSFYLFENNFLIEKEYFNEYIKDALTLLVAKTKSKNFEMYFLDDNKFPVELIKKLNSLFNLESLVIKE